MIQFQLQFQFYASFFRFSFNFSSYCIDNTDSRMVSTVASSAQHDTDINAIAYRVCSLELRSIKRNSDATAVV